MLCTDTLAKHEVTLPTKGRGKREFLPPGAGGGFFAQRGDNLCFVAKQLQSP